MRQKKEEAREGRVERRRQKGRVNGKVREGGKKTRQREAIEGGGK